MEKKRLSKNRFNGFRISKPLKRFLIEEFFRAIPRLKPWAIFKKIGYYLANSEFAIMKTSTQFFKTASGKPKPKSNMKLAIRKYKGVIVAKADCWNDDLKKTIPVW